MHVVIINGSPRVKQHSNTDKIIHSFAQGLEETGCTYELYTLSNRREWDAAREAFINNDRIIIALPLFVESAPSLMLEWLETLPTERQHPAELSFILQSGFAEEAAFLRIDCLYRSTLRYELDQSPTYSCMTAIADYFRDYPNATHVDECNAMLKDLNDRLDLKAFESAKLYYKMEYYQSAIVALKNILKDDSENIYREDILYYIAMSSYKYAQMSVPAKQRERYMAFMDDYLNFVSELPDSPYRKELDALYARAQRAIGRYAGTDEMLEKSEKDFARERQMQAE